MSSRVQHILDAAEHAAGAGDIGAAEPLLRQAVQLQETDLGPRHPDLANTLNNLGVVCEKTGQVDEAERCYRRAYGIAIAAFDPDHPFVITSRKNLADFCEAHGKAIDPPPPAPAAPATPASPPQAASQPRVDRPPIEANAGLAAKQPGSRISLSSPLTIAIALVAVLVLGAIALMRPSGPEESPPVESATPRDSPAASPAPAAPEPADRSNETVPPASAPDRKPAPEARASSARAPAEPTVATARVCQRFSATGSPDWRCERTGGSSLAAGSLVYYTRIKAASATTVEHRWYHGDDLQQRVQLSVAANSEPGYRTYSRLAVSASGSWRVELRTAGGALLHEERFTVR